MLKNFNFWLIISGLFVSVLCLIGAVLIFAYIALKSSSPNDMIKFCAAAALILASFAGAFYNIKKSKNNINGIYNGLILLFIITALSLIFGKFNILICISIIIGTAVAYFSTVKLKKNAGRQLKKIRRRK
ncbi:TIGR04086 family membrane protein [Eubacteriales bacterium OttesenSCG-928-G02]|nr:TIGR04086 family membrane protein [Eubacteriales bacterium OttesenSCG-928-G02]